MITSFFAPKKRKANASAETDESNAADQVNNDNNNNDTKKTEGDSNKRTKNNDKVEELLRFLEDDSTAEISWRRALDKHCQLKSFLTLANFVADQRCVRTR